MVYLKSGTTLAVLCIGGKTTDSNEMLNKSSRCSESFYLRRIDNLKDMLFWSESLLILIDEMFLAN